MGHVEDVEAWLEELGPSTRDTILVCGGRDYWRSDVVIATLDVQWLMDPAALLVHGACWSGADHLADTWARAHGVPVRKYKAEWSTYGKRAGPLRNGLMLERECPRLVIAFPGGDGTADMMRQARRIGVPVWEPKE